MEKLDDIRCLIMMSLDVHDELPEKKEFSLRHIFRRNGRPVKKSTFFNNSQGRGEVFTFDYSAIPAILAAAEKFTADSKEFFSERDRKPWIRHGSRLHFDVKIGPAWKLGKPDFAERSFDVEKLTAEMLEAELAQYNTKETVERARTAAEEAARIEKAIEDAIILPANTIVRRPLTFKPR